MKIDEQVLLSKHTTLKLGGPAHYWIEAADVPAIEEAFAWAEQRSLPCLVVGGGSNLVVADAGFDGLVVHIALLGRTVVPGEDKQVDVTLGAGETWDAVVADAVAQGWAGIECLSGIPGRVGATPMQNVGAYGQEVSDTIQSVTVWDIKERVKTIFTQLECAFSYRYSRFKGPDAGRYVILDVTYRLRQAPPGSVRYGELSQALEGAEPTLADVRRAVLNLRAGKGMVLDPHDTDTQSVGSFFLNPVVNSSRLKTIEKQAGGGPVPAHPSTPGEVKVSAAWLIEKAGFAKGYGGPHISISTKHTLALVHRGGGTTDELIGLATQVRDGVWKRFGVELSAEPNLIGCSLPPVPH